MAKRAYRVGIDVGLNSVGLAAIQVDNDGNPVRILKAQSVIHDGGVDPNSQKSGDTRKKQAGIARRTRRMRKRRRARLQKLDNILLELGYPKTDNALLEGPEIWKIRAMAADGVIENDAERKIAIALVCRHIARHRGWRNPYHRAESLLGIDSIGSEQYAQMRETAMERIGGEYIPEDATPAQVVCAVLQAEAGKPAVRIRTSTRSKVKGDREGIIRQRLMQTDNAYELNRIFAMQQVPAEDARKLILAVFAAVSPKGSAEKNVGRDPLQPKLRRALKASLAFQRHRIVNIITNLRIRVNNSERTLTMDELSAIYNLLTDVKNNDDITWIDVANELGIARNQLKGVGALTVDGDERVSNVPPRLTSLQRISQLKDKKLSKKLLSWWSAQDDEASCEAMLSLLSNTVDIDAVRDDLEFASAIEFIESLDDAQLTALDKVDLPAGRAAYSSDTLRRLTSRMLVSGERLHDARKAVFGVGDSWRPPQPSIGAPIGNPAVDRVLKITSRFLLDVRKRWGNPISVQIEHVRGGFTSVSSAQQDKRDYERANERRYQYRQEIIQQLQSDDGIDIDAVRDADIRRQQAITRQNGECLYCGRTITFRTCEMDHIVPRKGAGSTNTRDNFAAVCEECNRMKSNLPFAVWANTESAKARGVSLKDAIDRVEMFNIDSRELAGSRATKQFKQGIIQRLRQTEADDSIDNRSIESVAWMADELHRRIDWFFNAGQYSNDSDGESEHTKVAVYRGSVTAEARKASGIDGQIHFIGARYKTRIDRRHHAIDAAVIAMMNASVSRTLEIRSTLRISQRALGHIEQDEVAWKDYPTAMSPGYEAYAAWLNRMKSLLILLNDALDSDRIPVLYPVRYSLGNSVAHDATVHKLLKKHVGDAIDAETIRRASSPALYCALTQLPDYSKKNGLPADMERRIRLHDRYLTADEEIGFFEGQAAQIAVQGGSADIGSAIHHARVYKCYKENAKGVRKYFYGMVRVFQTDLVRARHEDLFTCPLPPQSISMRYAEDKVVQAIQSGRAEYKGFLVVGDVIELDLPADIGGQVGSFRAFFAKDALTNPSVVNRWVVNGFFNNTKLRLKPAMTAPEGLEHFSEDSEEGMSSLIADTKKVMDRPGWIPAINVLAELLPTVIRTNELGEPRFVSHNQMPISWTF